MTVDAPFRISSTILRCVSYLDSVTSDSTIPGSIATLYDNHMIMFSFRYRRIFVYTFCLINICLSLSDDANRIKTLNIERA